MYICFSRLVLAVRSRFFQYPFSCPGHFSSVKSSPQPFFVYHRCRSFSIFCRSAPSCVFGLKCFHPFSDVTAQINLPSGAIKNPPSSDTTVPYRRLNSPSIPAPRNRLYTIYSMRLSLIRKSRGQSQASSSRRWRRPRRHSSHSRNPWNCWHSGNGTTKKRLCLSRCDCI